MDFAPNQAEELHAGDELEFLGPISLHRSGVIYIYLESKSGNPGVISFFFNNHGAGNLPVARFLHFTCLPLCYLHAGTFPLFLTDC